MSVVPAARRLATAHWGLLAVCAGFLIVGALVLDDYGISWDTGAQRAIGSAALDYLAGDGERALNQVYYAHDRYYGAVFEAPLVLVERTLGLEGRDIWLSRHFLTHLFFLAGGVFCYLLVLRMFGSRLLALIAMALFLLHPRLYAHSFYNSKDVPFAAMFMIALYLVHRAFRRETLGAFLLCGVGVGVLVNLRVMGLVLVAAVLALRALDVALAGGAVERRRVLLTGGTFALAAALTYHATLPALWTDPGRFLDVLRLGGAHPNPAENFFRGEWLDSLDGPPFEYVPVWIGITTPPVVLLLAVIGVGGLCWCATRRARDSWRATRLRFTMLLLLLVVAVIVAIFVQQSNIYNGWRQVYFLYAPMVLLAILGLHQLGSLSASRWMNNGFFVLATAGISVTLVSMTNLHPLQHDYFNSLVDRNRQDWLAQQYHMDYWDMSLYHPLREILEDHPAQGVSFSPWRFYIHANILDVGSKTLTNQSTVFFTGFLLDSPDTERKYVVTIYNNTVNIIRNDFPDGRRTAEKIIYRALADDPVARPAFTLYLRDGVLVFFREDCSAETLADPFSVLVYPVDSTVLASHDKARGYVPIFATPSASEVIDGDGRCAWGVILPSYPIASVFVGRSDETGSLWSVRFGLTLPEVDPAVLAGAPVASSTFDVYRDGDALVYIKDPCTEGDITAGFATRIYPLDPDDLPGDNTRDGFTTRYFRFWNRGVRVGERCVAVDPLPDYPVAGVRTGQADREGWLWDVAFAVTPADVPPGVLAGEPLASSVFDVHRDGDGLVYVREGCTEEDTGAPFFLHVYPVRVEDLPTDRVRHGFDNLDFEIWQRGGRAGGRCVAVVALPDYPIASIHTGQPEAWETAFAVADVPPGVLAGEPLASSTFDVHHDGDGLVYVREGCTEEDTGAPFFLHVVPVDPEDLPADRVRHGFDNLDFEIWQRGGRVGGRCVATVALPDYPIASVATGQYDETGRLWTAEFALSDGD